MKNKKILVIGPYPPPFGGVSIHIKRLKTVLNGLFDIDIIDEARIKKQNVFNIRSLKMGTYIRKLFAADIVHIHSGLLFFRVFHFCAASMLFKKKIITIHGYEPGRGIIERTLDKIMLSTCSKTIFVSKEIADRFNIKKYIIKNAFLPPDVNSEEEIPEEVKVYIQQQKQNGYTVCVANAWRLDSHNSEDLYGLDLCVLAAKKLKETNCKVAFVFVVCEDTGVIKLSKYRQMITELNLADCFMLYEAPLSFIKLIIEADIVIRPTNTDGDALTVREGLLLGKTVIASDVVIRPEGTTLFENRKAESLANEIAKFKSSNNVNTASTTIDSITQYAQFYSNNIYN